MSSKNSYQNSLFAEMNFSREEFAGIEEDFIPETNELLFLHLVVKVQQRWHTHVLKYF